MDAPNGIAADQRLEATLVDYDHALEECTIHPTDVDEDRKRTVWMTARGDAFCQLSTQK